jgi:hypothetical protein
LYTLPNCPEPSSFEWSTRRLQTIMFNILHTCNWIYKLCFHLFVPVRRPTFQRPTKRQLRIGDVEFSELRTCCDQRPLSVLFNLRINSIECIQFTKKCAGNTIRKERYVYKWTLLKRTSISGGAIMASSATWHSPTLTSYLSTNYAWM